MTRHYERTVSMATESRALSRPHRLAIASMRKAYSKLAESEIEKARNAGMLRTDVPEKYQRLVLLNYLNWTPRWYHQNGPLQLDELAGIIYSLFVEGVSLGPQAPFVFNTADRAGVTRRRVQRETLPRLIEGAAELFAKHGYAATSTRAVATFLGMEKASLYYHVHSKEDLLYTICKSSMDALVADVEAALEGVEEPVARLRALTIARIVSLLRDQTQHATALAEVRALSPGRLADIVAIRKELQSRMRQVLEAGRETGAIRTDIPTRYLGLLLEGLVDRTVVWYRRGDACTPAELGAYFAELYLYGAGGPR
jgi:AcrR family transcriptional regulator